MTSSALRGIKKLYPDKDIYIITHPINFPVFAGNKFCYKKIPFFEKSTDIEYMSKKNSYFDICFVLPSDEEIKKTNRFGKDNIEESLRV